MAAPPDIVPERGAAAPTRLPRDLVVFTLGYLVASGFGAYASGNREFVFYIVVMIVLIAVVLVAHRRTVFSAGVLWALSIWGLLHMAGGLVPVPASWPIDGEMRVLYSWWLVPGALKYDHVVHGYGFAVTTWLCWEGLCRTISPDDPRSVRATLGRVVLCGAAGMGFGALNEVVEFVAVLSLPNTNVGGYINTGWDLVSNLVGCVVACVAIAWRRTGRLTAASGAGASS